MPHAIQYPENDGKVAWYDTEAEAETAQQACYANHMANHNDNPAYTAQTTSWDTPRQRLDGKWTVFVCHHTDIADATNIETFNPELYP